MEVKQISIPLEAKKEAKPAQPNYEYSTDYWLFFFLLPYLSDALEIS